MRIPTAFYEKAVDYLSRELEVPPYALTVEVGGDAPEGMQDMGGAIQLDHDYLTADIWLNPEVPSLESAFGIVVHEMLHLKLSPLDQLYGLVSTLIDKKQRKLYRKLYTTADEQVTVALQRLLTPGLWEGFCDEYEFDETGVPRTSTVPEPKRVRTPKENG